jgi:chemotaxis protein methyltransferase CheR
MMSEHTVQKFCSLIEQRLGLDLRVHGVKDLERWLEEQSSQTRLGVEGYVEHLGRAEGQRDWRPWVDKLTVGETYFFRHNSQLIACCDLIEQLCTRLSGSRQVRVLSVGCSTGEEPYSLAMLLDERGLTSASVEITGTDLNTRALERARLGRYSEWSLREAPAGAVKRWFSHERGEFRLSETIVDAVTFQTGNLSAPNFAEFCTYDFVLCRNVLMYFTPEQYRRAVERLLAALAPEGALFLGHAESLRGMETTARAIHRSEAIYYSTGARLPNASPAAEVAVHHEPYSQSTSFKAPLEAHSEVGEELTDQMMCWAEVEDLLQQERFVEALDVLEATRMTGGNGGLLCLRNAMLLLYSNKVAEAQALLNTLTNDATLAAEVHYALALCHEVDSRVQEAAYHHKLATHLDPTFAMPWLHLGMLSRRQGDHTAKRRELLQAHALLGIESPKRVLWFGGGCSRGSLMDVCRGELDDKVVMR